MPERGLDVSGNQTPTNATLVARLADPKYTFVVCKATEGQGFKDTRYLTHRANAVKAGKRVGAYHFAWPNQDPLKEAANFLATADLQPGMIACLDVENWGDGLQAAATGWSQRLAYTLTWLKEVKYRSGATPFIYMNWDWIKNFRTMSTTAQWAELCSYPLWLADYDSGVPGQHPTVNPKAAGGPTLTVAMHQWTANEGGLDGDYMADPALWTKNQVEDDMSQAQYDALMGAITALSGKVDQKASISDVKAVASSVASVSSGVSSLSGSLAALKKAVEDEAASTEVALQEAEQAILSKVSEVAGSLGIDHATTQSLLSGLADEVGTRTATVVSTAIVETLDSSLGGFEVSARFTRRETT